MTWHEIFEVWQNVAMFMVALAGVIVIVGAPIAFIIVMVEMQVDRKSRNRRR